MFEDLDWKGAFKRSALAASLYLVFIYVMSVAFPDSFGGGGSLTSALIVAGLFFLLYAPVFAFSERRKRRRMSGMRTQSKGKTGMAKVTTRPDEENHEGYERSNLRGRHNPNTSRRKAARRRRR